MRLELSATVQSWHRSIGGVSTPLALGLLALALSVAYAHATSSRVATKNLDGEYVPCEIHPCVLSSESAYRIYAYSSGPTVLRSRKRLQQLAETYVKDLTRYDTPYSGCDVEEYVSKLTVEGAAASVASTLATFSYIHSLNPLYGDDKLAALSGAGARQILLNWASNGFRENGRFRKDFHHYCDAKGKQTPKVWASLGLELARGMVPWSNAQDLLLALTKLNGDDNRTLAIFSADMFQLIVEVSNFRAVYEEPDCEKFSNQTTAQIEGLLAIARLQNSEAHLMEIADDSGEGISIPWTLQIEKNIYGYRESLIKCYPITSTSLFYHQTPDVQPGELDDRYRAKGDQPFAYSMGSLAGLATSAVILENAGFDAFGYHGNHDQTLLTSIQFFSQFYGRWMSNSELEVPSSSDMFPGYAQYAGHPLTRSNGATPSGADGFLVPFLIGLKVYPGNPNILKVIKNAASVAPNGAAFSAVNSLYVTWLPLVDTVLGTKD